MSFIPTGLYLFLVPLAVLFLLLGIVLTVICRRASSRPARRVLFWMGIFFFFLALLFGLILPVLDLICLVFNLAPAFLYALFK